ncbi:TonB-dependent receptor [Balneolaceae bacterium ANBcel3]|nr:TonB-dependent receptor [Balneolaceae bacterium ANBcel3]
MKQTLLSLVALLFVTSLTMAQPRENIYGHIYDATSGEALLGANVIIQGTNIGASTGLDGEFVIRNAPVGEHTLVVTYIGYVRSNIDVEVIEGQRNEIEIQLPREGLVGDEVVISVQALGQAQAINRQLSSRTISNMVSSERIREVPDVNAAESLGRLPGVSIQRSGGEASKIAIRGLSPKYNTILVGGVRLPATDRGDRSVDLSMISPNMLHGIEMTKAITPNQDADAIGGTVDLQLRRAPEEFQGDFTLEGGYNYLRDTYNNYKFTGSLSDRFLDNRFGAIVNFNFESRDRSTDTYDASYTRRRMTDAGEVYHILETNSINLRDSEQRRDRRGGSLFLDYRLPEGSIAFNTFYSLRLNDQINRNNYYGYPNEINYDFSLNENELTVWSNMLAFEYDFNTFSVNATGSFSQARNYDPEQVRMEFISTGAVLDRDLLDRQDPNTLPLAMTTSIDDVYVYDLLESTRETQEDNWSFKTDISVPFRYGMFSGSFDFGGKFTHLSRDNVESGRGMHTQRRLYYGGGGEYRRYLLNNMEGWSPDPNASMVSRLPLSDIYDESYSRSNFLPGVSGDWPVGLYPIPDRVREVHQVFYDTLETLANQSFVNDYDGTETLWAGYAMAEINIGNYIMFLPGFRYEHMETDYSGFYVREVRIPSRGDPIEAGAAVEQRAERTNDFFLPMWHLQISPTDWMDIRFARTHSITRPDYMQFSPRFRINYYGDHITAGNSNLVPAEALNHDISLSIYTNRLGLITISGFHKKIENLIWHHSYPDADRMDGSKMVDFDYSSDHVRGVPTMHTSLNNENDAFFYGAEIDLQTNFWWLPRPLDGLVLNVNYSRIKSEMDYPVFYTERTTPPGSIFPVAVLMDSTRTGRLPDQPRDIANIQVGYDYKGFSGRVSFQYIGETLRSLGSTPDHDHFTEDFFRIDAMVRQKIIEGLEVFANANNINNRPDRNFQAVIGQYPTYVQSYGVTFDLGVRYQF